MCVVAYLSPCSFPLQVSKHFFFCSLGVSHLQLHVVLCYKERVEKLIYWFLFLFCAERAMKKRGLKHCFTSSQVVLSMIMVQGFVTGMQLLSRVILVQGSFIFSLIAYRHIVAAICVAPFALYFERYVFHSISYFFIIFLLLSIYIYQLLLAGFLLFLFGLTFF